MREANKPISYQVDHFWIKNKRFARVAEWKADTAAARERTAHFHQRDQRRQSVSVGKLEVKRPMVISLVKHLCPGAGVETASIAMQRNNMIPTRLVERVKNPHLQWFAARFRLHKRIIAREMRFFFRFQFS